MKDKATNKEEGIWSAIRYLDPDEKKHRDVNRAVVIPYALALLVCLIWLSLYLRDG